MNKQTKNNPLNDYAKYSSIGLQIVIIICLGIFCGFKLDETLSTKPIFTICFSILSIAGSLYSVVKKLLK
ncbi:MAG: AtpZ/AtpI family protein [Bacteroidales bacterium]|nr:AtpZ/AtpI family protein [Bacteroidales bacterium]